VLGYTHPESLATTEWVADRLDDPRIRPVEVFWGSSASWGRPAYEASHIPGVLDL
jgi:3-mercaptopyruvate sulfurtransferase SseA